VHLDSKTLDGIWTTIARGNLGFLGFQDGQASDTLKPYIWVTVFPSGDSPEVWEAILKPLFNDITLERHNALITIRLEEPLKDPRGLLRSVANRIDKTHLSYWYEQDRLGRDKPNYTCHCGHSPQQHWLEDGPCTAPGCGCHYFGQPLDEWEQHILTYEDGPGSLVNIETVTY